MWQLLFNIYKTNMINYAYCPFLFFLTVTGSRVSNAPFGTNIYTVIKLSIKKIITKNTNTRLSHKSECVKRSYMQLQTNKQLSYDNRERERETETETERE